jgi:carboxyl-terminal processing protease
MVVVVKTGVACAALLLALSMPATNAAGNTSDVTMLDLIETDLSYTTISDQYYRLVQPQVLLDGARAGLIAYLHGRGIAQPQVAVMHARADGRFAVPAIEQQIGRIIVRYGSRVDARELVYGAIRGELAALHDPYSVFFTKPELTGFSRALDGETFGGIGIVIAGDETGAHWRADQVFENGPAAKAGLQPGDEIVSVDGAVVAGKTTEAVRALLRGKIGSVVHLAIARGSTPVAQPLAITRAAVTPPEVTARVLNGTIAYVALRTFGATAGKEVRSAVQRLRSQGARACILDLRGNGGGYESAAVHVASVFVPWGPIVSTQENHGKRHVTQADGKALSPQPLVVLVDRDSASGSELVAAAIADTKRGTLIGVRTYGKGLVQTIVPLPDGAALKLTTARYFTAGGHDIDRVGITPDIIVEQTADAVAGVPGRDPQLDRAIVFLSADMSPSPASTGIEPL